MKFIFSQMAFFMALESNRRNMRFMLRFALFTVALIFVYSLIFHNIMGLEGREYSMLTGLYWTMTVMSTLGFGDITFTSDLGMMFSILVLLSGIILFMLVLPFTFIRFVYSPWLEAQSKAKTPRELPKDSAGHVIIVGTDSVALSLALRCEHYEIPYVLLTENSGEALSLYDRGYNVVFGETDSISGYAAVRAEKAALILALHDDLKNTNIASTAHEYSPDTIVAASANNETATEILRLAGCQHVLHFPHMLGESLARRVFSAESGSNIIVRFEGFCIAESPASGTALAGKRLRDTDLRSRFSLNVAGIWQGKEYLPAKPDMLLEDGSILLLVGTADKLANYDRTLRRQPDGPASPTLILGGGRVGGTVVRTLERRKIPYRVVEQKEALIPKNDPRYIHGDAADIATLREAGLDETQNVIVTTHNDDLNIYLTIYCRKLRPDIKIISRATLDRNVPSLYDAGANLVMSQAGLTADTVINLLKPGRVIMFSEGLNIFRVPVPPILIGQTLKTSGIRQNTDCNVIAVQAGKKVSVPPDPARTLAADEELILIGTAEAETHFMRIYTKAQKVEPITTGFLR
ncbi:MAG: NAD-binding protein [Desulfovibrio sp.]|jgi:Trk K+ transport system NAD-binding subunit|nr:NAD-binding protein [Desulfovibrio sp.]